MSFTTSDVIEEVRELVQDTDLTYRRNSNAFLLGKVNQSLKRLAVLRPDLFIVTTTINCVAGAMQTAPSDSIRLVDVISADDGLAVKEVRLETLDLMFPAWGNEAPGPARNWMRYVRDPNRFYVYPPAATSNTLSILYTRVPSLLVLGDTVVLQDAYFPAVVDCTAWLVESTDSEGASGARAKAFKDSFMELISSGLQARKLTDVDSAGLDPKEVV